MAAKLVTKNATATVTEASYELLADAIKFIANDDTTNDLYISLNGSIADGNDYMIVKAGETFSNFDEVPSHTIYYKASASTVAFRVVGIQI
jgi:hypothetical protein